jgi:inosine/xanthosine triphosphate pyrophosphatase family protein
MKLEEAIARAALVTFEGMLASVVERDGTIWISADGSDGLGYDGNFLANEEITIDADGSATVLDLDGDPATLVFYIPMKG